MKAINNPFNIMKVILLLFVAALIFAAWGCGATKSIKETSTIEKHTIDTVTVNYKTVEVQVPGAVTPTQALDLDSLVKAIAAMRGSEKTTTQIIKETEPIYITSEDTEGAAILKYWVDEYGKLQFNCTARDRQVQALVAEVERLRSTKEKEIVYKEKIVKKTKWLPTVLWSIGSFILGAVALYLLSWLYAKRWTPII